MKTRETLETAIRNWLNRETQDIIDRTPDFITLAETRIFSFLRCRTNEVFVSLVPVDTKVSIPAKLSEVQMMSFGDAPALKYKPMERYANRTSSELTGTAENYSRFNNEYIIWPFPDGSTEVINLWYYEDQVLGFNPTDTTETLLASPGLYLFGALLEAEPYLKNKDQVSIWQGKYDQAWGELMGKTALSESAGATNQVESAYHD